MLTGVKDVDRMILNKLEDTDLINVCKSSKQANSLCNDPVFWMNRVFQRYPYVPGDVLRKFKGNLTWSEYYIGLRKIQFHPNRYLIDGSKNNRFDQVIIALKNGANIETENNLSLSFAIKRGHLMITKYLVENGANIHVVANDALARVSQIGNLEMVKFLVEKGADIHYYEDYALRWASKKGHLDIVKFLINSGADIHAVSEGALVWASEKRHLDIVKYLVEHGADLYAKDEFGWDLYPDIVKYIKSNG